MAVGDNNPRVFAQTIALDAWRTPFDGESGLADLHIDVVFDERGPVGGEGAPVRFRLSLKHAELHVVRDSENIIDIKRSSVLRADLPESGKAHHKTETKTQIEGGLAAELSAKSAKVSANAKGHGSVDINTTIERNETMPAMAVTHWPTERGYGFKIAPKTAQMLKGQPWRAGTPVMQLRDTNANRKRGEPPEIRIEIHCLREHLVIEQIELTGSRFPPWAQLPWEKRFTVENFIKDELARHNLPCGELSDPFAHIILGDAIPSVET